MHNLFRIDGYGAHCIVIHIMYKNVTLEGRKLNHVYMEIT